MVIRCAVFISNTRRPIAYDFPKDVKRYGISGNWSKNTEYFQSRFSFSLVESFFGKDKLPLRYSPKSIGTIFLEKKISSYTISLTGKGAMEAIGRQPDASGKIQVAALILAALVEGIGFAALFAL